MTPEVLAHLEWLGYVQPVGLVVSATALDNSGAVLNRRETAGQDGLARCVRQRVLVTGGDPVDYLPDFHQFAREVLGWTFDPVGYAGGPGAPFPDELRIVLPDEGGMLEPLCAVREREPGPDEGPFQLLVLAFHGGQDLDTPFRHHGSYDASPSSRMERLLRETGVPAGLVFTGTVIRLLVAPRGESSGWIDFRVDHMLTVPGRPIAAALRLLLSQPRLLTMPKAQRLPALLRGSRRYQSTVSVALAGQVLHGLYELVRGFQAARASRGSDPVEALITADGTVSGDVYHGLLTVMMRLLFLLYAEERDLLPGDEDFRTHYGLAALFERLREDATVHEDTMDQRYGAWAQLLMLFRMVHDGVPDLKLVARKGSLFDPDAFPFLEGRRPGGATGSLQAVPRVPDGTVHRVLEKLLMLGGERLSYRSLDVEHIGSVYETMMGFRMELAPGQSVAIGTGKKLAAPVTISLDALLAERPARRADWLADATGRTVTPKVKTALVASATVTDLHAAVDGIIDTQATPDRVPAGSLVLQPSEERRRSGSHYTPRDLTGPIVTRTLAPVLARLRGRDGRPPAPEAILGLAVCDPAMGSAAFLVETCRQLGDALVGSWQATGTTPPIPADEDVYIHARRLVAQRCLYGVDRNPVAVELAKVSVWLATLAKDHALTFLDHAFRHGDSLVGLSTAQIGALGWEDGSGMRQVPLASQAVRAAVGRVASLRRRIQDAPDGIDAGELRQLWDGAQEALGDVRLYGDLVVRAFFDGDKPRARQTTLAVVTQDILSGQAGRHRDDLAARRHADRPLVPFHWSLEFPEVFDRPNPGFDAIVGNPPFMGGSKISTNEGSSYLDWVLSLHDGAHGNCDLVAHFFRRTFGLIRHGGASGLIATNTIAQGDTRAGGLAWICQHGGEVFHATRRLRWPGMAAVIVSFIHIAKGGYDAMRLLDGKAVDAISAFLVPGSVHTDPTRLAGNAGRSFKGSFVLGMGFTFEHDADDHVGDGRPGMPTSVRRMEELLAAHPHYHEVILPYIGGEEVNSSPTHAHRRFVINFGNRTEAECRVRYPGLMAIVEAKVRPERMLSNREGYRRYWWHFGEKQAGLQAAIAGLDRVLVISAVTSHVSMAFVPAGMVLSHKLIVFPFQSHAAFAALQSRPHEAWARFFSSTMKDDLNYSPTDCFETFPFPADWETRPDLESVGREYYEFRASLLVANNQGLTTTYNRFHDPLERDPQIVRLRELHAAMDRAVLDAYGWHDVPVACAFVEENPEDEDAEAEAGAKPRRRKYRYRWPDDVRDDVMGRLIALNTARAAEEARRGAGAGAGTAGQAGNPGASARTRGRPRTAPTGPAATQGALL